MAFLSMVFVLSKLINVGSNYTDGIPTTDKEET